MTDQRLARLEARVRELDDLSDEDLKQRFWALSEEVVAPLIELARTHTSPSIERSVLMRMGIDSVTSQAVVTHVHEAGLLGRGAGHVVLRLAGREGTDVRAAAAALAADPALLHGLFEAGDPSRTGGHHG
jgi:D-ornithine 4,5-aminomutase subunit alpha